MAKGKAHSGAVILMLKCPSRKKPYFGFCSMSNIYTKSNNEFIILFTTKGLLRVFVCKELQGGVHEEYLYNFNIFLQKMHWRFEMFFCS